MILSGAVQVLVIDILRVGEREQCLRVLMLVPFVLISCGIASSVELSCDTS